MRFERLPAAVFLTFIGYICLGSVVMRDLPDKEQLFREGVQSADAVVIVTPTALIWTEQVDKRRRVGYSATVDSVLVGDLASSVTLSLLDPKYYGRISVKYGRSYFMLLNECQDGWRSTDPYFLGIVDNGKVVFPYMGETHDLGTIADSVARLRAPCGLGWQAEHASMVLRAEVLNLVVQHDPSWWAVWDRSRVVFHARIDTVFKSVVELPLVYGDSILVATSDADGTVPDIQAGGSYLLFVSGVEGDTLVLSESRFAAWSADGTDYEVRRPMGFALEPTSAESTCAIWSQASVAAAALIDSLGGVQ